MSVKSDSVPGLAKGRRTRNYALAAVTLAVALAIWGVMDRVATRTALAAHTAALAIPTVSTTKPLDASAAEALVLPGSVQAFNYAPIYARTSGYLLKWYTDIGAHVKHGQLLAEIDTPEVDQELRQARADLATAQANYELARTTDERWKGLLTTKAVSQQAADAAAADAAAKKSVLASSAANVARLSDLESFKRVVAPFDGVVTSRNTDIGALINSGQGGALFSVADVSKLRIYVQVPQLYAPSTRAGLGAEVTFPERPGKTYPAQVISTADALDPNARTLQIELLVDNRNGDLFPGAYAQVRFDLPAVAGTLRLPATAFLFRSTSLQVAVVGADRRVALKDVTPGRDFGTSLEVLSGLNPNDAVIVNPSDSLASGTLVNIAKPSGVAQPAVRQTARMPPRGQEGQS
jgi:RND family efflux transporter MFP subunit